MKQAGCLKVQKCKVGWKAGSFYTIKSKEQGKEKRTMSKGQGSKYRAQSWLGIWGMG